MILPGLYAILRKWPAVTGLIAGTVALLLAAAYLVENLTDARAWGGFLLLLAFYAAIFTTTGLIVAATISIARTKVADVPPIADPPSVFRASAIMSATTIPLAFLAMELNIDGAPAAATLMLILLIITAATAFGKPRGTVKTYRHTAT